MADQDNRRSATLFYECIDTLCRQNSAGSGDGTIFCCITPPPISLRDYALRFADHLLCSAQSFVVAATILLRIHLAQPQLFVANCAHKLMLGAQIIGIKFTDDKFYPMSYYSQVGGVTVQVLISIEEEISRILAFRFFVTPEQYSATLERLESIHDSLQQPVLLKPQHLFESYIADTAETDDLSDDLSVRHQHEGAASLLHRQPETQYRSAAAHPIAFAQRPASSGRDFSVFDEDLTVLKEKPYKRQRLAVETNTSTSTSADDAAASTSTAAISPMPISQLTRPLPLWYAPAIVPNQSLLQLEMKDLYLS